MNSYDFQTLIDRSALGSAKWAAMQRANPQVPAGIPPFSVADLDLSMAPEITTGLRDFLDQAVFGYTQATPAYVDAVIDWMHRRHGWSVQSEWIVQSAGVVPALATAIRAFSQAGNGVIVQPPVYYPFYGVIEKNRRRVVRNPLQLRDGHYRMDFAGLRALARDPANTLLLLCSPHNPVGRVWTREELDELAAIVLENDLILVSDEIHFDLVLPPHRHTVVSTLGREIAQRSIVCTAPSKSFNLAGMSASNIVIEDEHLRERFKAELEAQGFFFLTTLGYKACELAYTRAEAWLEGLLRLIEHNRVLVKTFLAEHLPQVEVIDLQGTYLQWLDFRALGKSAAQLQAIHEQQAWVFFDEGGIFGPEGEGFERMNLATPTTAVVAALERLAHIHAQR